MIIKHVIKTHWPDIQKAMLEKVDSVHVPLHVVTDHIKNEARDWITDKAHCAINNAVAAAEKDR